MIYLVGCDHIFHQTFVPKFGLQQGHKDFRAFIKDAVRHYDVSLIAEELSDPKEPDLENPNRIPRSSVALDLANELKATKQIEHRYCEPCSTEKDRLGIGRGFHFIDELRKCDSDGLIRARREAHLEAHLHDIEHRWPIREEFWIKRLGEIRGRQVLFICGALHRCTFGRRLRAEGVETEVLDRYFGHPDGLRATDVCPEEFAAYRAVCRIRFPQKESCPCISLPHLGSNEFPSLA